MGSSIRPLGRTRRDFLRKAAFMGTLLFPASNRLSAKSREGDAQNGTPNRLLTLARILSVDRFAEMRKDFDDLKHSGFLSRDETFRGYLADLNFELPEKFKQAKSIIVLSVFTRSMAVRFHQKGKTHEIVIPPQYYDDGVTPEDLKDAVRREFPQVQGCTIEPTTRVPLKTLAVRSGLGRYGRNNICYVEGMGSYLALYAFFTDFDCKRDDWSPMRMLEACGRCVMCHGICPSGAIRKDPFVIDAGRCITLANEIKGRFPKWIRRGMHDALMGCMKCQKHCPENALAVRSSGRLEDVTEEETQKILEGAPDDALLDSLKRKLKNFYPAASKEAFPIFSRNLKALIE